MIIYTTRYGQRTTEKESINDSKTRDAIIRYVKKAKKDGAIIKTNSWKSAYWGRMTFAFYIFPTQEDYDRECQWYARMGISPDWEKSHERC